MLTGSSVSQILRKRGRPRKEDAIAAGAQGRSRASGHVDKYLSQKQPTMSQAADLTPLAKCNIDDDEDNSLLLDTQYERALKKIDQAAVPNSVVYGEIIDNVCQFIAESASQVDMAGNCSQLQTNIRTCLTER
jgi:hypothetical protein